MIIKLLFIPITKKKSHIFYGKRKIIYNDIHQKIYYKNGNIFNNSKTVFYDCKKEKIETVYENGLIIVKYKNGKDFLKIIKRI